ncbi:MAG: LysR family transcriptional regulator [Oceanospirillaceae bacterium]|nr:LysR family transcriptional regulator [Oceanospirillaceae bacterium]
MIEPLFSKKLPPLKSLRGFESTARLLSFRKAAAELNLTHPAISHQIQSLEEDLKVKLFDRRHRQLTLTNAGKRYYPMVREALELLISASEVIRRSASPDQLKVQSYVSISIRWLAQRLSRFRTLYPQLALQLISTIHQQGFDEGSADLAIIFCRDKIPSNIHWTPLFKPTLFPVCAAKFLLADRVLTPEQLQKYPLITVTSELWHWSDWFNAAGLEDIQVAHNISTDSTAMAVEMAMDGEGIALVNGPFFDRDLAAGRLMVPSAHQVSHFGEWGIACGQDMQGQQSIKAFTQWLIQDIHAHPR